MSPEDPVPRFFSFLLAFMGSMLGIVLSGNLVQMAFFWELTSLFSFLLIGYWHHNQSARDGARIALITPGAGGVCLWLGLLLIGRLVGSLDIDQVVAASDLVRSSDLYMHALVPILIRVFTHTTTLQSPFLRLTRMNAQTTAS